MSSGQMVDDDDYMVVQTPGNPGLLATLGLDGLLHSLGLGLLPAPPTYTMIPKDRKMDGKDKESKDSELKPLAKRRSLTPEVAPELMEI